jgi:hypothetical protein
MDEHDLAGKECTLDEFRAWLEPHHLKLETATVDDYYRWRMAEYRSPRMLEVKLELKSVTYGQTTPTAIIRYGAPGGPSAQLALSRDRGDGGRWKLDEVNRVSGLTYTASFDQRERAEVRKKRRNQPPSPAPSAAPASGSVHPK